jgi:hypothetical protein
MRDRKAVLTELVPTRPDARGGLRPPLPPASETQAARSNSSSLRCGNTTRPRVAGLLQHRSDADAFLVLPGSARLFDCVTKRFGILAHAVVPRDDGYQWWRLAEQFRGREVDGVECADRFDRKGTADSIEHRSINVEDEAAPLERSEGAHG